jgi:hypothetical protein
MGLFVVLRSLVRNCVLVVRIGITDRLKFSLGLNGLA